MLSGKVTIQIDGKEKTYKFDSYAKMQEFIESFKGVPMQIEQNYSGSWQEIVWGTPEQ